jgi:hypothetical protein
MITPEMLASQVDELLKTGNLPDIRARCAEIEKGALLFLANNDADIRASVQHGQRLLMDKFRAVLEKRDHISARLADFTQKCAVLQQDQELHHREMAQRGERLRVAVEERKQELARKDQERWYALQVEIGHLLTRCRRQIEAFGNNNSSHAAAMMPLMAGHQQQHQHQHQQQYQQFAPQQQYQSEMAFGGSDGGAPGQYLSRFGGFR